MTTPAVYTPQNIEAKWQQTWFGNKLFASEADASKPKYYVLEMLPYPSGQLHMGHVRNYTLGDVLARYKRAAGFNVMHPMGWDSFGLPAENAALKRGIHPQGWTLSNIAEMKRTMQQFGWSYDRAREVTTCLPSYYGHQQALFLDLAERGLVYRKESHVNWDPVDQTVLANEQVVDGKGWRSGAVVERRLMPQWMMKITQYADQLLADLDKLPHWPHRVKVMQENWLGKSYGVEFSFELEGAGEGVRLPVYTTRPDTIMGTSFCVLAPEHPLSHKLAETDAKAAAFILEAKAMGTAQEIVDKAEKKGYPTPYRAIHPFTGEKMPVWIGNFVLMTYGTGAIKSAPAHDERDFAFATKYNLPIRPVITGAGYEEGKPYGLRGTLINSGKYNGLTSDEAIVAVIADMEKMGIGQGKTNWRLRDWGISRQRYWGCPIPFVHCEACGVVPVPRDELPVKLPEDVVFDGQGNPLDKHPTWKHTPCPACGKPAVRETDTMDTFADSSWYFLRYLCPDATVPLDKQAVGYWMANGGVDQYIGGIEHAVLHLLYARFFTKALRDCGYPVGDEPFNALLCQGMVIGNTYVAPNGDYIYPSQVEWKEGKAFLKTTGEALKVLPAEKISKSKNNGDSPDSLVEKYGADTLRLFMLFTAPPERDLEWSEAAIEGAWRYLNRVWTLAHRVAGQVAVDSAESKEARDLRRTIHKTIRRVTFDIERFQYNTMVAACMELANALQAVKDDAPAEMLGLRRFGVETLVRLLNPAVPHITEELWQTLGGKTALALTNWPTFDAEAAADEEITVVVQVNGKLRGKFQAPADITEAAALAQARVAVTEHLAGLTVRKEIYVAGKLVNIVAN
ncbi:MAG: leucine--tRNA ligase [Alphaproteobacteria bacterium]